MTSLALDAISPSRHVQIRMLSRLIAWAFAGFTLIAVLVTSGLIAGMLIDNPYLYFGPQGGYLTDQTLRPPAAPGYVLMAALPMWRRLFGALMVMVQFAPGVMVLLNVQGLFRLYADGAVFTRQNAQRFKHIGLWLIAYAIAPGAAQLVMRLTDTAIDRAWFLMWEVHALVLGAVLLVIALVMEVGREIEQERAEFV